MLLKRITLSFICLLFKSDILMNSNVTNKWLNRKYFLNFEQVKAIAVLVKIEIHKMFMKVFKNLNAASSAAKSLLGHSHAYFQQRFHILFKSSRSQILFKIGALKDFGAFTGKHLRWSLFLIKLQALTLLRMGLFRAAHGWGGRGQKSLPCSFCYTYPTIMKLDTVIIT